MRFPAAGPYSSVPTTGRVCRKEIRPSASTANSTSWGRPRRRSIAIPARASSTTCWRVRLLAALSAAPTAARARAPAAAPGTTCSPLSARTVATSRVALSTV